MPDNWLDLARDTRNVASKLVRMRHFRSASARAYYAAYSKVNHELMATGLETPPDREGFGHKRIREVIITSMPDMNAEKRHALSRILGRLYDLRVFSDYSPSTLVDDVDAREAITLMNKVFEAF